MTSEIFLEIFDPPRPHFTQPISTARPQNLVILSPPPPPCGRHMYMVPYFRIEAEAAPSSHLAFSGALVITIRHIKLVTRGPWAANCRIDQMRSLRPGLCSKEEAVRAEITCFRPRHGHAVRSYALGQVQVEFKQLLSVYDVQLLQISGLVVSPSSLACELLWRGSRDEMHRARDHAPALLPPTSYFQSGVPPLVAPHPNHSWP